MSNPLRPLLPYSKLLRGLYRKFRRTFFSKPRPEGAYFRVDAPRDSVNLVSWMTRTFGRQSFAPNWEFSYNKKGEVLNLARVVYQDLPTYDPVWWQVHVRGWLSDDGNSIFLKAHWEPEPTEYPVEHLDGVGFSGSRGMHYVRVVLEDSNIEYEEVEYER